MIEFTNILLVLLVIILIIILIKNLKLDIGMSDYFDAGKNINFQLQNLRIEGFTNNNILSNNNISNDSNKLDIRKTNNFIKVFSNDKYTVWEPKQIDNYLPVGHVITKKNKRPKEFAILVNAEKSKKPDKFNIISISNDNFGIWQPISNDPNFVSLGNIYSKEYPSKYAVRLVNKKFANKTDVSKMVIDNKVQKNDKGYELWQIKDSDCFACNNKNNVNEFDSLKNIYSLNNILIEVSKKLYIRYTRSYKKIVEFNDTKLDKTFVVWRPLPPDNFCSLGDIILNSKTDPNNLLETIVVHKSFCKSPINYGLKPVVTFDVNDKIYSVWEPVAQENYHFLGSLVVGGRDEPTSEDMIFAIPIDYLVKDKSNTHNLVWNNVNEENPKSLWKSNLNFIAGNNSYTPPKNKGITINRTETQSDIDLLDKSKTLLLSYKKNNKEVNDLNKTYIKNLTIGTMVRKFDLEEDRVKIDNIDEDQKLIRITILPRKIEKNSITVEEATKDIQQALKLGDIKVFNEDKSNYLIVLDGTQIIKDNLNDIEIDNNDYKMSFGN